jgi:hypothetical protein
MSYSYTFANAEETIFKRENNEGVFGFFSVDPLNPYYAEFLSSGATAAPYVEPPVQQDLRTDAEKLEQATGLTVAEIKAVLGL